MREMKDSGIEWVGNIPNNWIMKPYRNIITQRDGGAWGTDPTEDNQMICMRIADFDYEKFKFSSKPIENLTKRKYTKRQILNLSLQSGDILIEKSGGGEKTPVGRAIIFDKEYPALFANFMDRIRVNNNEVIPRFVVYWLGAWYGCKGSPYFINQTTGIQNIALTLFLAKAHICYPKLEDQQAIANFLDAKCADIDSLTGDIQKQIDILKEYKKSVITRAVTKGLDPNVEMKDSGIAWIGKIPKHWIYPKLTYILDTEHEYPIGDGDHGTIKANDYVQEGIPFIRVQNLGFATPLRLDDVVYITKKQNITIKNSTLKPDDILFAKTGATIGKVGIVPKELLISNTTSHVGKITVNQKIIIPRFLFYALSSTVGYKLLWDIAGQKSTRPELSIEEIKRLHIILPDSLQEQQTIVDYLDAKCANIDAAIAGKQKQLDVLKEYKKSLIYEYVTGKKEVPCRE